MDYDVIIAGGGLNGLTQALALARTGFAVALADGEVEADRPQDVRAYALAQTSVNLMRSLGVWDQIARFAQPMERVAITDGRIGDGASPLFLVFEAADSGGLPSGFMVEQGDLRPALIAALRSAGATLHFGERIEHVETSQSKVTATLGASSISAAVLIAADGKSSELAAAAGIKRTGWSYGQSAIVMKLRHSKPHDGVAHQFFTPAGPLALLPLTGQRTCVVWTESTPRVQTLMKLSHEQLLAAFAPLAGAALGDLALDGAPASFPLQLSIANAFYDQRLALIGDAAHVVHPLAGQGLNAGLKDVAALTEVLIKARRRGEDIGQLDVLARYEAWRRFDIAQLAFTTDAINRTFSNDSPLLRAGRDLALGALAGMTGVRRILAREASGQTGDLPPLLRP